MSEGIVVAHVGDIPDGEGIQIEASVLGTVDNVAVFNEGEQYYALDDTCTHETASLAEGWVEDGCIECPLHAAKFCLADGKVQTMPATVDVYTHGVVVEGDEIRVIPNPERMA